MYVDTRYLFLLIRFKYRSLFSTAVFSAKADAKIQPFSNTPKYFFKKFLSVMPTALFYSAMHLKKNFHPPRFSAPQNGAARAKKGKNWRRRGAKRRFPVPKRSIVLCNSGLAAQKPARRRELSTAAPAPLPHGAPTDPVRPFFSSSSVVFQCRTEEVLKNY